MPDLISRLSETLDEVERIALGVPVELRAPWSHPGPWVTSEDRPVALVHHPMLSGEPIAEHIASWDPHSVLRLVAAHREVIEMWRRVDEAGAGALMTAGDYGRRSALDDVIAVIASGYGIEEEV